MPGRPAPDLNAVPERGVSDSGRLDLIECDGCGRNFATGNGPAMLDAIKGTCPTCGGKFKLRELDD